MTSERLETCEEELKTVLEEIQRNVDYQLPRKQGDDRRRSIQVLEKKLNEAETLLREVELEMRMAPLSYQQQILGRVRFYREDIASLKRQVASGPEATREELFSTRPPEEEDDQFGRADPEKVLLLKNTDTLKRASQSLHRAKQVSAHTDELGVGIVEELHDQKETLVRTRNRLVDVDQEMDRTTSVLRTMACNSIKNRFFLIGIIILEVLILAGVLCIKIVLSQKK